MNAPLPEPLTQIGVVGLLAILFPLAVWLLQGGCYFCQLEVPSFSKASLVMLAVGISDFALRQIFDLDRWGEWHILSLAVGCLLAILIQSLMLNLSLFDSFRVLVTTWLLGVTGAVVLVLVFAGGSMLFRPVPATNDSAGLPTASVPGEAPRGQSEVVFMPSQSTQAASLEPPRQTRLRLPFSH